ncbi:hypothetical protein [Spodoptera cosmioides nucleopolyhedrovirus]|uniref:Uncharacterized protein n=1 Tax=Spodoptera cosmioides nucleopolyhedrovirus TaxID=2605774 RepID=A0A6B7KKS3_9ABAC|nr:hypothetical protein [Spodoptera cosmioides nucleopolyhedrovirus]
MSHLFVTLSHDFYRVTDLVPHPVHMFFIVSSTSFHILLTHFDDLRHSIDCIMFLLPC